MSVDSGEMKEVINVDMETAIDTVVATQLTSQNGWEIINQLFLVCNLKIQSTQVFIYPVMNNIETIREKLVDPEAFEKSFMTLINDITRFQSELSGILNTHIGREGVPEESDWDILFNASTQYSSLMDRFDGAVTPLIAALTDTLKHGGCGDLLVAGN